MTRGLGELEQLLLFALIELGDEAHGVAIRDLVQLQAGKSLSPGAVHTGYERLQKRGFVDSSLGEPTPTRGGRRKRHYRITSEGARALHRTQIRLQRMAAGNLSELERLADLGK